MASVTQTYDDVSAGTPADIVARSERLPVTGFHIKARVIVGMATLFDGFDAIAIAYVLPVIAVAWKLNPTDAGQLIASANFGQLLGAVFFGWLADRIGRLQVLTLSVALFSLACLGCAFTTDYQSLFVMRFIEGLGLGGEVPVAAAYISEMARARGRGAFFLLYETIFAVGLLLAAILGAWLVPKFGWQIMFYIGAAPAFLALAFRFTLPESARWLADRGRHAEADAVITRIEARARAEGHELPPPAPLQPGESGRVAGSWAELFSPVYRGRTFAVWAFWFCNYFASYGISTWLPTFYRTTFKLDLATALWYSLGASSMGLCGAITVSLVVDTIGRRRWFIMAFAVAATPLFVLWYTGAPSAEFVLVVSSLAYFFVSSNSVLVYLYTAEIYPTRLRARGTSVATAWNRLASTIAPLLVGPLLTGAGLGAVFLMFGCVLMVGSIVAFFFAIETRNRVLEEISP